MTPDPVTVTEDVPLADVVDRMEAQGVKRLPVMRSERLVGIVTRANVLQAVASLGRHVSDPTADDDHIRIVSSTRWRSRIGVRSASV